MTTPGDILLANLIADYRRAHYHYAECRKSQALEGLCWVLIVLILIMVPAGFFYDRYRLLEMVWFVIGMPVFCALGICEQRWKMNRAKRTLGRLKAELEDVGMRIARDTRFPGVQVVELENPGYYCERFPVCEYRDQKQHKHRINFTAYDRFFRIA